MKLKILILLLLVSVAYNQLIGQDSTSQGKEKIKTRVDKIVKEVFRQIENELGADIYDNESESEAEESEFTKEDEFDKYEKHSLYAFPRGKKIPRNNSAFFIAENLEDKFLFRYNRVEGLFLGLQSPHQYFWDHDRKFTIFGSIGYGFGVHRWEYKIGLAHQLIYNQNLFEAGIEAHNSVDSRDQWLVGNLENSLSAMLFKYDYKDYFLRKGFSTWLSYNTRSEFADLQAKVAFNNDNFTSLQKEVNWSLFRSKRIFRENPEISEGHFKSISLIFAIHKLDSKKMHLAGWSATMSAEFAGKSLKGDYDFDRYLIDIRRYQPISRYDNLNFRLRAATSQGHLPLQYKFELGGISTLPAYSYKELQGNRLLLANIEYIVNGSMFSGETTFPLSLLDKFNLILFYDAGFIGNVYDNESFTSGFQNFKFNSLKSDWGIGIGSADGKYRLSFAWKTDKKSTANVFLRINRPF